MTTNQVIYNLAMLAAFGIIGGMGIAYVIVDRKMKREEEQNKRDRTFWINFLSSKKAAPKKELNGQGKNPFSS